MGKGDKRQMQTPKMSIIIPIYNTEQYLNQCIDSILDQSYKDLEIILIDDGSTDKSPEICDEYEKKDKRVRVIHKTNGGQAEARNFGIDTADGDYILFMDSDDWWDDAEALERTVKLIEENKSDVYVFGVKKYFQEDDVIVEDPWETGEFYLLKNKRDKFNFIMQNNLFNAGAWNKIIKKEFIDRNNMRFVVEQRMEDIEWCAKILLYTQNIVPIKENFYIYRKQNNSSVTSNVKLKSLFDILSVIKKYSTIVVKKSDKDYVLHYLAHQYIVLMAISNRFAKKDVNELLKDMKKYWWLIKYHLYPYVNTAYKFRFLGFNGLRKLLGLYLKNKTIKQ